uniref:Uncharacterized protein n=1 Tax=Oryza nivara TaxID=4536 RepID=A0A0E0JB30_ORYNI
MVHGPSSHSPEPVNNLFIPNLSLHWHGADEQSTRPPPPTETERGEGERQAVGVEASERMGGGGGDELSAQPRRQPRGGSRRWSSRGRQPGRQQKAAPRRPGRRPKAEGVRCRPMVACSKWQSARSARSPGGDGDDREAGARLDGIDRNDDDLDRNDDDLQMTTARWLRGWWRGRRQ